MRFPLLDQLDLPCTFVRVIPGDLHPDGRRYLPQIVLRLADAGAGSPVELRIVDRHHRVDLAQVGSTGSAKMVLLLSLFERIDPAAQLMLRAGEYERSDEPLASPEIVGRVTTVASWEHGIGQLAYETLYTELALEIGSGSVGLRTSLTAPKIVDAIGTEQVRAGDILRVWRSRIDILQFWAKS